MNRNNQRKGHTPNAALAMPDNEGKEHPATSNVKNDRMLITEQEFARRLNVSPQTIKRRRKKGLLKAYYFGHRTIRYMESDVDAFIAGAGYQSGVN